MDDNRTIFKRIADAAAATLQGLPEVGGRVYVDLDAALDPDRLPALLITLGDDSSELVDDDTCRVRVELQVAIVTESSNALASVDVVERAVYARMRGNPTLDDLLAGVLRRISGTRRVLRNTEGTPALRQLTYECKAFVSAADMASMP